MRKRPSRALLIGGATATAAALTLTLSASPSIATTASTWTVKPGGKFTATNIGKITVRDATTGVVLTCTPSSLAGKLESGSRLPGAKIASITKFSFGSCHGPGGLIFALKTGIFPYHLNANSYTAASGQTMATATGIRANLSGSGCTFLMDGTTVTTGGRIKSEYANSTNKLKLVASGSTLQLYDVSAGCLGLWNTGDHMTISGTYTVTPAQTITSP
jgi:hypothetical protein